MSPSNKYFLKLIFLIALKFLIAFFTERDSRCNSSIRLKVFVSFDTMYFPRPSVGS